MDDRTIPARPESEKKGSLAVLVPDQSNVYPPGFRSRQGFADVIGIGTQTEGTYRYVRGTRR